MEWGWDNGRALLGIALIVAIAWLFSENRKAFPWKIVLGAILMQFVFTGILFGIPVIREALFQINKLMDGLIAATAYGTQFVFSPTFGTQAGWEALTGQEGPIFAVHLLPLIIVVASLSAVLWHWKILRWITRGFASVFQRFLGIGGATSLAVSANVFMGMTEAPILIKPYLKNMTRSEIFIMMTAGFATVAGSVLVVYGAFLKPVMANPLGQLLVASLIAAPAAVALALVMVPETKRENLAIDEPEFDYESTMDAFSTGASDGLKIIANIVTMLIAAFAALYLTNLLLGWFGAVAGFSPWQTAKSIDIAAVPDSWGLSEIIARPLNWLGMGLEWVVEIVAAGVLWVCKGLLYPFAVMQRFAGDAELSIQLILGWIFAPLMYMIGVPWEEASKSGSLIGIKTVLTEFVAFIELANIPVEEMTPRTRMITAHAINGFANFGSIGILIGGLSIIEPAKRTTFLELAWRTLVAGTLATCMSGAVVGALPFAFFGGGG